MSDIGHKRPVEKSPPGAKRGRPKKKPDYDLKQNINLLLEKAVSLFRVPYDDRVERSTDAPSISYVAEKMNTSRMRVRKLLITAGYYSTHTSRSIQELYEQGMSIQEIGNKLGLERSAVHNMLPYKKGIYKLEDPTLNAEQLSCFNKVLPLAAIGGGRRQSMRPQRQLSGASGSPVLRRSLRGEAVADAVISGRPAV